MTEENKEFSVEFWTKPTKPPKTCPWPQAGWRFDGKTIKECDCDGEIKEKLK